MKILVIDDDVVSRMVLMHLVDSCGTFEILEAEDGQDAWDQLQGALRPALCFCDLRMPRLSGMELLGRVRAERRFDAMPFILVTAATEGETVQQASGLGAAGYIVKPFKAEQVRVHIAALYQGAAVAPLETMQRLGIDGARLLRYLGGLQGQLASAENEAWLASADPGAGLPHLERLQAGCGTLGLAGAAAALKACRESACDAGALRRALAGAQHAAMYQGELVKRLLDAGAF